MPLRERLLAGSLAFAFFAIPLYPAFIMLTGATVPGVALLPKPAAFALLAASAVAAAIWLRALGTAPKRPLPTLLPLAALPAAASIAAVLGLDPLAGIVFIAILALGVIWHAAILRFFREPGVAAAITWAYLVSGALASLAAIVMVIERTPVSLFAIGHGRAIGTFVLPGELAGYLILYVPIAVALGRASARAPLRALAWTGCALGSIAFAMTFSRAGWAGMAAALAVMVFVRRPRNGPLYAGAVIGAALLVVALLFNAHHDPSENFTRLSIWQAALDVVQRFPFTGVGPFEFAHVYPFVRLPGGEPSAYHAHDVILSIAAETGLAGVFALAFGWWRFVAELVARLRANGPPNRMAVAIAAGLAGTWVQGLVDTVSVVIFGLWLPMMALALGYAGEVRAAESAAPRRSPSARRVWVVVASVSACAAFCALVQLGSDALYARAASPHSLPAHVPPAFGIAAYEKIERVAPLAFVEATLADDALARDDTAGARTHAERLPAGAVRSDLLARAALVEGRAGEAVRGFLAAGDDEALQRFVSAYARAGRVGAAAALERRIRDRLAELGTRPNAVAEGSWRLGRLEVRLSDPAAAQREYDRAIGLAPLNTKYLIDAGVLALQRHDAPGAMALFARASAIDPRASLEIRRRRGLLR
jgi:putative inorganic carbon (HCO3(-)) transporter